ncbi:hypothetical protein ASPTUDRAFT_61528 [Aspergillus tubingensis CBS 134.48]|uniref:Uncharacterized protein n=1 Tax=Aspergillus tubingensis (strain CBS 134.48) TaxID=767770 RepID=A0A1L9NFR2_ASPTC|nr:hypothetical protein ASPTUDRAFT_61528 [Aspergillus tubingensis CBS 134.48]
MMLETQDAVDEKVWSTVQTVEMGGARGRVRVPRLREDRPVNREPQADHPRNFKFFYSNQRGLAEGGGDWPIVQRGLLIGASTQIPRECLSSPNLSCETRIFRK